MNHEDGSPEMEFRGTLDYQSTVQAGDLEVRILSARLNGQANPIIEVEIMLDDDQIGSLTLEVLDEIAMISDAGITYRCHRLPYGDTEVHGVTLLIPQGPDGKKALISVSY